MLLAQTTEQSLMPADGFLDVAALQLGGQILAGLETDAGFEVAHAVLSGRLGFGGNALVGEGSLIVIGSVGPVVAQLLLHVVKIEQ